MKSTVSNVPRTSRAGTRPSPPRSSASTGSHSGGSWRSMDRRKKTAAKSAAVYFSFHRSFYILYT